MFGKGYVDKMEKFAEASEALGKAKCLSRIIKELEGCKPFISKMDILDLLKRINEED